jgi:hypothetical protein
MSPRYLANLTMALIGGFLVVASRAFAYHVVSWIGFGLAIAALALGLATVLLPPLAQRVVGGAEAVLAIWTLVASRVFSAHTADWLIFASAIAFVVLAVAGLTIHELSSERVVHALELHGSREAKTEETYARA